MDAYDFCNKPHVQSKAVVELQTVGTVRHQ